MALKTIRLNKNMEYAGEKIWRFIFESGLSFWITGLFILCLLVFCMVIWFLFRYIGAVADRLGHKP